MKTMTKIILACTLAIIACVFSSCGKSENTEYEQKIIEQEKIFLANNEELLEYCNTALDYLDTYIKNPNYENLKNARIACVSSYNAIEALSNPEIVLSDELIEYYISNGVSDMAVIPTRASSVEAYKNDLLSDLKFINDELCSLSIYTDGRTEYMTKLHTYLKNNKDWYAKYFFLYSNYYIAATMPEKNCVAVKAELENSFPVVFGCTMDWKTNSEEVLSDINALIDEQGELEKAASEYLGESEAELQMVIDGKVPEYVIIDGHPATIRDPSFFYTSNKTIKYVANEPSETEYETAMKCIDSDGKLYINCENVRANDFFYYIYEMAIMCLQHGTYDSLTADELVLDSVYEYFITIYSGKLLDYSISEFVDTVEEENGIVRDEYTVSCNMNGYDFTMTYKDENVEIITDSDFSFMPTLSYLK